MSAPAQQRGARLPLFPLHSALLPGGLLPLRIFETRYLDMVRDCLREGGGFGVCLILSGSEVGAPPRIHTVGTLARIVDWDQRADGLLGIVASGERRFRVRSQETGRNGLLHAEVEWLEDSASADVQALPEEYRELGDLLRRLVGELGAPFTLFAEEHFDHAGWVANRLTELLPLAPGLKQSLVELDDAMDRLRRVSELLRSGRFS
ncbi:LON peptidase substrate-binding domain-containing protein [Acidihalobacter prosperus]